FVDKSRFLPTVVFRGEQLQVPIPVDMAASALEDRQRDIGDEVHGPGDDASDAEATTAADDASGAESARASPAARHAPDPVDVPLIRLAWARSGDKGDTSNIGVVARSAALVPVLREQLSAARVAAYLAHLVEGPVVRYELPGIGAFNFVCERALGGGGMASLRNDPLGKGMAQMLLSMPMR